MTTPAQRAEIQESKVNGFLNLVSESAGQEDRRDVGLMHLDIFNPVGVGALTRQGFNRLNELHGLSLVSAISTIVRSTIDTQMQRHNASTEVLLAMAASCRR